MENYNNLILISGIPPSRGGVGRLMKNLLPIALKNGYSVITKRESTSIKGMLRDRKIVFIPMELFLRLFNYLKFILQTYFLKDKIILFIHPQTAGVKLLNLLISRNKVYLYVMDNSFFCVRSYNIHPVKNNECLTCLGDPSRRHPQCLPFPILKNPQKMVDALLKLKKNASKLTFLVQNNNQERLLKEHFGKDSKCILVGMDTNELAEPFTTDSGTMPYDIVFHGNANIAKGAFWFVEVAKCLPQMEFFMPCSKNDIDFLLGRNTQAKNITFSPCTWEGGLKDIVQKAKLVCVPSLWSAPIEGALLKSMTCNGRVAVVRTKYGFSQEIPENVLLHLSPNPSCAAMEISEYMASSVNFQISSHEWLQLFREKNTASNLFKAINSSMRFV